MVINSLMCGIGCNMLSIYCCRDYNKTAESLVGQIELGVLNEYNTALSAEIWGPLHWGPGYSVHYPPYPPWWP